jgi:hypothetical protein
VEGQVNISPIKNVSAWLPIAMSLVALSVVLGHVFFFGIAREPDEGAAAHIFQFLMAAQIPVVGFFALNCLSRAPKQTASVLAFQVAAALGALAPVCVLGL